jgi:hypothetical protein
MASGSQPPTRRGRLKERGCGAEALLGMGPNRIGLQGTDPDRAVLEALHSHDAVAMLMDAVGDRNGVALRDVLTVRVKVAAPLALIVPFETAVQTRAEVKARL